MGQLLQTDRAGWLQIRSRELLRPGQGLVLERLSDDPLQPPEEVGGRIMVVEKLGGERLRLRLGGRIKTSGIPPVHPSADQRPVDRRWQQVANG